MISSERLQHAYAHARLNRQFMTAGAACRCFYCLRAFSADAIDRWVDDGSTALCPNCGVDAVLSSSADPLSDALIQQLHATYFERSEKFPEFEEQWQRKHAEKPATAGGA